MWAWWIVPFTERPFAAVVAAPFLFCCDADVDLVGFGDFVLVHFDAVRCCEVCFEVVVAHAWLTVLIEEGFEGWSQFDEVLPIPADDWFLALDGDVNERFRFSCTWLEAPPVIEDGVIVVFDDVVFVPYT